MDWFAGQKPANDHFKQPNYSKIKVIGSSRPLDHVGMISDLHVPAMNDILVIDDKAELRSIIAATLTHAGYHVRQAADGRKGIMMVLEERPDLILCDVRMPEMDGYRTLAAIREFRGTAAIPFILMTGSMGRDEFRNAMVCGADDYLLKPFSTRELIAAVRSRLARQTNVQTEVCQRLEVGREHALPPFFPASTLAGASRALAAGT